MKVHTRRPRTGRWLPTNPGLLQDPTTNRLLFALRFRTYRQNLAILVGLVPLSIATGMGRMGHGTKDTQV